MRPLPRHCRVCQRSRCLPLLRPGTGKRFPLQSARAQTPAGVGFSHGREAGAGRGCAKAGGGVEGGTGARALPAAPVSQPSCGRGASLCGSGARRTALLVPYPAPLPPPKTHPAPERGEGGEDRAALAPRAGAGTGRGRGRGAGGSPPRGAGPGGKAGRGGRGQSRPSAGLLNSPPGAAAEGRPPIRGAAATGCGARHWEGAGQGRRCRIARRKSSSSFKEARGSHAGRTEGRTFRKR